MPLIRAEVPRLLSPRLCRRAARAMERLSVHQLLNVPSDWRAEVPLPPLIPTRGLWREKAPESALLLLRRTGLDPARSTVELFGDRFDPEQERAILSLAPRVRSLSLSLPVPDVFLWSLQREYGIAAANVPGDIVLCYAPADRARMMPLWQERPQMPGLTLSLPRDTLPEGCPALPLLAALADQGHVRPEEMELCPDFS